METIFNKVLYVGTDPNGQGGVASVLNAYRSNLHPYNQIITTGEITTTKKVFRFIYACIQLPYWRIRGKKIIHIHSASYNSFKRKTFIIILSKIIGYKVIFHLHGAEFHLFIQQYSIKKIKFVLGFCDAYIVLSKKWKALLETKLGLGNIFCINNMINQPRYFSKCLPPPTLIYLLFLGTIGKRKGVFDLLSAILSDKEYYQNKIRLLVGGNGETDKLKTFIKENELGDIVSFLGWVSKEDKANAFIQSNIFILPSYNEGLPVSVLEALSYGLPVISTPVGGIPEIVHDGVNGILVNPGSINEIDAAIKRMIKDASLRTKMSEESQKIIKDYYPANVRRELVKVYLRLLR